MSLAERLATPKDPTVLGLAHLYDDGPRILEAVLASGRLANTRTLSLVATPIGSADFVKLISRPELEQLERLFTGGYTKIKPSYPRTETRYSTGVDDAALDAIARLPNLRVLELTDARATPAAWERFIASPLVPMLTHFCIENFSKCPLPVVSEFLMRAKSLRGLCIGHVKFGAMGLETLMQMPAAGNLERLQLPWSWFSKAEELTLINANFPRLVSLDLRGQSLSEELLAALNTRTGMRELKTLILEPQTSLNEGEIEQYWDGGSMVGSGVRFFYLYELDKQRFAASGVNLTDQDPGQRGWFIDA